MDARACRFTPAPPRHPPGHVGMPLDRVPRSPGRPTVGGLAAAVACRRRRALLAHERAFPPAFPPAFPRPTAQPPPAPLQLGKLSVTGSGTVKVVPGGLPGASCEPPPLPLPMGSTALRPQFASPLTPPPTLPPC